MKKLFVLIISIGVLSSTIYAQESNSKDSIWGKYTREQDALSQSFSKYFYGNYQKIYSLNNVRFTEVIDSLREPFADLITRFQNENSNYDTSAMLTESTDIHYFFAKIMLDYPYYHERYTGEKENYNLRLDDNLKDFNNPTLLKINSYVEYLKAFLYFRSKAELENETYRRLDNRQLNATFNLIDRYFSNQKVVDFLKFYYLYNHIDNLGIKNIDSLYNNFVTTCKDTSYIHKVEAYYASESHERKGHLIKTYKTVDGYELDMHLFLPATNNEQKRPLFIYFHGGSWAEGKPDYFFAAGEQYAKKGWVAAGVEYRIAYRHGTLPFESVMDAKSAIRWLRQHADEYNIDTNRIVAYGNSAGGHLVLCTALVKNWNEDSDDLKISCVPNVLLVVSGVFDLTDSTSWIRQDLRDNNRDENLVKEISPNYLIEKGLPPTLIIHGTNDQNVPFSTAVEFVKKMKREGNSIEFHAIEGAGHYMWYGRYGKEVSEIVKNYLGKLGY